MITGTTVDASEVERMLNGISDDLRKEVTRAAIDNTAKEMLTVMKRAATPYSVAVKKKSASGWTWTTYGRISKSIAISKLFKRGRKFSARDGDRGKKVFVSKARGRGFLRAAWHAHLILRGYRQFVPTGLPGKGQVRRSKIKPNHPGDDIFFGTVAQATRVLRTKTEEALQRSFRRNSQ